MKARFLPFCMIVMFVLSNAKSANAQTQFWVDDFESANSSSNNRVPSNDGGVGGPPYTSYFCRTPATSTVSQVVAFSNFQGSNYWAGEAQSAAGTGFPGAGGPAARVQSIVWDNINISGKTGLSFTGAFAANSTNQPFDNRNPCGGGATTNTDYVILQYKVDGGNWTDAIRFFSMGPLTGKYLFLETTGDSCGDGAQITNVFQNFSAAIPNTGTTLSLRLLAASDGSSEEWGIDNFQLSGTNLQPVDTLVLRDSLALVALYNSTNGAGWTNRSNWLSASPISTWYGVTTDANGRVVSLNLPSNNLDGTLPEEIGNLTKLQSAFLFSNVLHDTIPAAIGNLSDLQSLYLNSNQLSGSIPAGFGNLLNLEYVFLDNNQLTGSIPSIASLTKLTTLAVDNNKFTFTGLEDIAKNPPQGFGYSPQANIKLSKNDDTLSVSAGGTLSNNTYYWYKTDGTLAKSIVGDSSFVPLKSGDYYVWVTNAIANQLTLYSDTASVTKPTDPLVLRDSLALVELYNSTNGSGWTDHTNWLTGPLSGWKGVTLDADGRVLNLVLSSNNLVGSLPASIGDLTRMIYLNLGFNKLSGAVPSSIGNLSALQTLYLYYNQLTDSLPSSIGNLTALQIMNLDKNQFSDSIPSSFGNLSNLISLSISQNKLTGAIPASLGNLSKLESLALYSNQLSDTIPASLGNLSEMYTFYLGGNALTGSIPASFGNMTKVQRFAIENNKLTGSIPSSFGNMTGLSALYLNGNALTGAIPASFGNLSNLEYLFLYNNQLSDSLPSSLGNLSKLIFMAVSENQFSGSIPASFGNLSALQYASFDRNRLTDTLPASLGNLSNLISLSFSSNQLTGSIPASLGSLSNLQTLDLSSNQLSGSIPAELGNLSNLKNLSLYFNALSGAVPAELSGLSQLQYLTLGYNRFTFAGIEELAQNPPSYFTYNPQANIRLLKSNDTLSVSAGGTLADNTYDWYNADGEHITTIKGDSTFVPTVAGSYYVLVTNSVATNLTLYSDTVTTDVLPVHILSFTGSLVNSNAVLEWTTTNEINTSAYTVERSVDGIHFTAIGSLPAQAGGAGKNNYSFTDPSITSLNASPVFYRLREADRDSRQMLSSVVAIKVTNEGRIAIYPNPAKDVIHLSFGQSVGGNSVLELYDITGKRVLQQKLTNSSSQPVYLSSVSSGTYHVVIWSDGKRIYQHLLLISK